MPSALAGTWSWNRLWATCRIRSRGRPMRSNAISKLRVVRLVAPALLGRDDEVEVDAEPPVRGREQVVVAVGDDREREAVLEPGERRRGVGERRPVDDAAAERRELLGRRRHAQLARTPRARRARGPRGSGGTARTRAPTRAPRSARAGPRRRRRRRAGRGSRAGPRAGRPPSRSASRSSRRSGRRSGRTGSRPSMAPARREGPSIPTARSSGPRHTAGVTRRPPRWLIDVVETLALTLIAFFVIQTFIAQPFQVKQTSMETTLEPGQYVLVDKLTPRLEPLPARRHRGAAPARRLGGRATTRRSSSGSSACRATRSRSDDGVVYVNGDGAGRGGLHVPRRGRRGTADDAARRHVELDHRGRRAVRDGRPPRGVCGLAGLRADQGGLRRRPRVPALLAGVDVRDPRATRLPVARRVSQAAQNEDARPWGERPGVSGLGERRHQRKGEVYPTLHRFRVGSHRFRTGADRRPSGGRDPHADALAVGRAELDPDRLGLGVLVVRVDATCRGRRSPTACSRRTASSCRPRSRR